MTLRNPFEEAGPCPSARNRRGRRRPQVTLRTSTALGASILVALIGLAGCSGAPVRTGDPLIDLKSEDPIVVQNAIKLAVDHRNLYATPLLIENLRRDNPIRMWSIMALYRMLGDDETKLAYLRQLDFGWLDEDDKREHGVQNWEEWYQKDGKAWIEHEMKKHPTTPQSTTPKQSSANDAP